MRILFLTWRDLAHPESGGAEVYTEHVARRWAAAGHEVTLFAASVPSRPHEEVVDGYRVVRRGGRLSVYRAARRWYRECGRGQFDLVIDMVNTVPFTAHRWITDTPVIAFFHQTAEECWRFNAPLPVALVGRYLLEPRWIRSYRDRTVLVVSQSTADSVAPSSPERSSPSLTVRTGGRRASPSNQIRRMCWARSSWTPSTVDVPAARPSDPGIASSRTTRAGGLAQLLA